MAWFLWLYVFANTLATGLLWQRVARGPKRKFARTLLEGRPVEVRHERPPRPEQLPNGRVPKCYPMFFADFAELADILNRYRFGGASPWRLQESAKSECGDNDGPWFGRCYKIFYNQIAIGDLKIWPSWNYSLGNTNIHTEVSLSFARLLSFSSINNLISSIAECTSFPGDEQRRGAIASLQLAALEKLWRIEYDFDLDDRSSGGYLELALSGSAAEYLNWSARFRAEGS
jgi:hypothetical protein